MRFLLLVWNGMDYTCSKVVKELGKGKKGAKNRQLQFRAEIFFQQ
jgi:hypothetical protein